MNVAVEKLRRRIALYRRYLREGLDGDLSAIYLEEIGRAEAELSRIMDGETESSAGQSAR